jgi:hypothetical protein
MLYLAFRVVREQLRRNWGDRGQYLRFGVLAGWCFVYGSTVIDRTHAPITWRTYATAILLTLSAIAMGLMRRQQRAAPPTEPEHGLGIGKIHHS